mmetsp:Transcript_1984/g.3491  ORF Transcript_1984/g.3491 Transcript_1984/m.3491 type:complete len:80 (-) Transcript_1984:242-481(-)
MVSQKSQRKQTLQGFLNPRKAFRVPKVLSVPHAISLYTTEHDIYIAHFLDSSRRNSRIWCVAHDLDSIPPVLSFVGSEC